MSARRIAEGLAGKTLTPSANYLVRCVSHDDANPSLSLGDGERGLLVRFFVGCDPRDVLTALRRRGLLDVRSATAARASQPPTCVYGFLVRKSRDGPQIRGRPRLEVRDDLKRSTRPIEKPLQYRPPPVSKQGGGIDPRPPV